MHHQVTRDEEYVFEQLSTSSVQFRNTTIKHKLQVRNRKQNKFERYPLQNIEFSNNVITKNDFIEEHESNGLPGALSGARVMTEENKNDK